MTSMSGSVGGVLGVIDDDEPQPIELSRPQTLDERLDAVRLHERDQNTKHDDVRHGIDDTIGACQGELREIAEQISRLNERYAELEGEIAALNAKRAELPDAERVAAQGRIDRLAALQSTLKADRHRFDEMVTAVTAYREALARRNEAVAADPEQAEAAALVAEIDADPGILDQLPPVARRALEVQLANARATVTVVDEPEQRCPAYVIEAPADDGAFYAVIVPAPDHALHSGDRGAVAFNAVLGAFCDTLDTYTAADAPRITPTESGDGLIVWAADAHQANDLFGPALDERLGRNASWVQLEVLEVNDSLLVDAVAQYCRAERQPEASPLRFATERDRADASTVWALAAESGVGLGTVVFRAVLLKAWQPSGRVDAGWAQTLRGVLSGQDPGHRPDGPRSFDADGHADPAPPAADLSEAIAELAQRALAQLGQPVAGPAEAVAALVATGAGTGDGTTFQARPDCAAQLVAYVNDPHAVEAGSAR